MGPIEGLRQADLVRADIFSALALSDEAGWNQVAEDWALFIDRGNEFLHLIDHRIVLSELQLHIRDVPGLDQPLADCIPEGSSSPRNHIQGRYCVYGQ